MNKDKAEPIAEDHRDGFGGLMDKEKRGDRGGFLVKPNTQSKKVRTLLTVLVIALFSLTAFSLRLRAEESKETITAGIPADRCPMFYLDPDTGEITGIGVDVMKIAGQQAGYDVVFTVITERSLKEALDNAAYDVILPFGSAVESARGKKTVVSDNLLQMPFTLVTLGKGELPPISRLRIGMLRSMEGGAETVKEHYPETEISFYETMDQAVKALRNGREDALLHNSFVWSYVLQKPSYNDLTVQPSTVFSMDFRAGTLDTEKGRALIERLNGGAAKLTDPMRQAVILDHTSRRLYRYDLSDYLYQYGLLFLLTALLVGTLTAVAVMRQRAERREHEEKIRLLTDHDPLTGALSLHGFRRRAEELLKSHPETRYMLSYINIKNFKYINDSLGMDAGDALLKFWVDTIRKTLGEDEIIGRITADRFVVLSHARSEEDLVKQDQEVLSRVRTYFIDRGRKFRILICGGIYLLTAEDYQNINIDHMLDFARLAEKKVRETKNDGFGFYNPEQWERGKRVADVINHLPAAIASGDLRVWYQPQVDYEKGIITGAEALCRWDHAMLGFLYPFDFIAILEESGLIYDLDCYVWEKVCQDLQRWNSEGYHPCVSVNVSRVDIREDRDIPGQFKALRDQYGIGADQLRVEITETAFAENPSLLIDTTNRLREYGFQVEMDDFGSGYSSLHMLKEVPVDRIKLDMNFLTETGDPEKCRTIVSCMIGMIHQLGMKMIAEGVETKDMADFLKNKGCREMQGYYFYRPMPMDQFEKIMKEKAEAGDH